MNANDNFCTKLTKHYKTTALIITKFCCPGSKAVKRSLLHSDNNLHIIFVGSCRCKFV